MKDRGRFNMKAVSVFLLLIIIGCKPAQEVDVFPTESGNVEIISIEDDKSATDDQESDFELQTGNVQIIQSQHVCADDFSRNCIKLNIACNVINEDIDVTLYIDEPAVTYKGTITFHSGSGGKGFWAPMDKPAAKDVMEDVKDFGFRTIEVRWGGNGWLAGSNELREGITKLSCRPATLLKWIHNNLYSEVNGSEAFCSTGNSGGSVQISESLINYGLDKYLDLIVPTAGPGLGRLDEGCLNEQSDLYLGKQKSIFDKTYGYFQGDGPCKNQDENLTYRFVEDSLALGERDFYHPQTKIHNLVGAEDIGTATNSQSQEVYNRWDLENTPYLDREVLGGVGHGVQGNELGAQRIKEVLLSSCKQY